MVQECEMPPAPPVCIIKASLGNELNMSLWACVSVCVGESEVLCSVLMLEASHKCSVFMMIMNVDDFMSCHM